MKHRPDRLTIGLVIGLALVTALGASYQMLTLDASGWVRNTVAPIFGNAKVSGILYGNSLQAYSGDMVTINSQLTATDMYSGDMSLSDTLYADAIKSYSGSMAISIPFAVKSGTAKAITMAAGQYDGDGGYGGSITLTGGTGGSGTTAGGSVQLHGGSGAPHGNVVLQSDSTVLVVDPSGVTITGLPTSEPATVGALWVDGVTLKISDGP